MKKKKELKLNLRKHYKIERIIILIHKISKIDKIIIII